jgi:glycosyltransferase involved in cell wall biosynthesis
VYTYVSYNNIADYEILYVDSRSTDNSIEIVKNFNEVIIFEIIGEMNAAIARNIGAKEAKGDTFVFLDADMEIEKDFHKEVFDKNNKLLYPFVSGQLKNIFYNADWKEVDHNLLFPNLNQDEFHPTTGGYFIITKDLWFSVNGMKTKYKRSQDLDLGLRLAKSGTLLFRKKDLFVKHHTIDYQNKYRMWKMLFNGSFLYSTSLLYREHTFNKYNYRGLLRKEYSFIALIVSILLAFYNPFFLVFYLLIIGLRSKFQGTVKENSNFLDRFVFLLIKDCMTFIGFFTFFPKNKKLVYKKAI